MTRLPTAVEVKCNCVKSNLLANIRIHINNKSEILNENNKVNNILLDKFFLHSQVLFAIFLHQVQEIISWEKEKRNVKIHEKYLLFLWAVCWSLESLWAQICRFVLSLPDTRMSCPPRRIITDKQKGIQRLHYNDMKMYFFSTSDLADSLIGT